VRAQDLPVVGPDDPALVAARLIAERRLPGTAVDADGRPVAVLPASQVLRFVVPDYVQEDPALVRVVDEAGAERLCLEGLSGERVKDLLPSAGHKVELAAVDAAPPSWGAPRSWRGCVA
jgi:hypothetical protein